MEASSAYYFCFSMFLQHSPTTHQVLVILILAFKLDCALLLSRVASVSLLGSIRMNSRLANRRTIVPRLWMLRGLWRRLVLRLILVRWRTRSGLVARQQLQERDLKAVLPLARTMTMRVLFLQHRNAATIKPRILGASPQRRTFSTPPPPSFTPTALGCTSDR